MIPGAGPHHQAFQRGETHAGVVGETVLHGIYRGAVADMADNDVGLEGVLLQQHGGALGHVEEGGAVETVAADTVLLVPFMRQRVGIGEGRHSLVPGGIHDGHVRDVRHQLAGGLYALDVGRVVERRQRGKLAEGLYDLGVDEHGLDELLAAVHHAVPYGRYAGEAVDNAVGPVRQRAEDELYGLFMGGAVLVDRDLLAARGLVAYEGAADADALHHSGGERGPGLPVEKRVFHGRASAVKAQYFHLILFGSLMGRVPVYGTSMLCVVCQNFISFYKISGRREDSLL